VVSTNVKIVGVSMSEYEDVYIGDKPVISYINAGVWALGNKAKKPVRLLGRGGNIKTTVDTAEILKRQMINPKVNIEIDSEDYEDRKVSTITIILEGKKKKVEEKE